MQRLSSVQSLLQGAEMQESCREPGARGSAQPGECDPAAFGMIVTSGGLCLFAAASARTVLRR